jgi:hypothetical protein
VDLLVIAEHDDHRSLRLHLLLVIEIFSVGLLGRRNLPTAATRIAVTATVCTSIAAFWTLAPLSPPP